MTQEQIMCNHKCGCKRDKVPPLIGRVFNNGKDFMKYKVVYEDKDYVTTEFIGFMGQVDVKRGRDSFLQNYYEIEEYE